jgi:glycosyltransferase involved in cell wall biosynthesis
VTARPRNPKRILLATTVPITIEAFLLPLVKRLAADGWEVDAIAHGLPGSPAGENVQRAWDVSWSRNPLTSLLRAPAAIRRIRSTVKDRQYALVHVQTPVAGFLTRLAIATMPGPHRPRVIYTAHGFHFHPQGRFLTNLVALTLERLAARWTDAIIVTNATDLTSARRHRLLPPDRVILMPGVGVDVDHNRRDRVPAEAIDRVFAELGLRRETPLIVCVAELNRNKRQSFLVQALAQMKLTGAHLVLRGDGPEREHLVRLARELGVGNRVHLMGFQPDPRPLMLAARVFALVSRREGLPRVVMEALSLEVPVVGTDIRGMQDLLAGDLGTLVPPDDVAALAATLDTVIGDPDAAAVRARRGRLRMVQDFGLERVLDMQMELYDRLYASPA